MKTQTRHVNGLFTASLGSQPAQVIVVADGAFPATVAGPVAMVKKATNVVSICVIGLISGVMLLSVGCSNARQEIPETYRGEFSFDRDASVAFWETQEEWPRETKDQLIKMAIPTTLKLEATKVVVTDVATGETKVRDAVVEEIGDDFLKLSLHSNFAQGDTITTFRFDEDGFWMLEGTLFPNYRERFVRNNKP